MNIEARVYEIIRRQIPADPVLHTMLQNACEKRPVSDVSESVAYEIAAFVLGIFGNEGVVRDNKSRNHNIIAFIAAAWMKKQVVIDEMMKTTCANKDQIRKAICLVFVYNGVIEDVQGIITTIQPVTADINLLVSCALTAGGAGNRNLIHSLWKYEPQLLNGCLKGAVAAENKEVVEFISMLGNDFCDYEDILLDREQAPPTQVVLESSGAFWRHLFIFFTLLFTLTRFL